MLARGTAFFFQEPGDEKKHVWFVLTDPNHPSGKILCVNFATPGGLCPDNECFVGPSGYAWLRYRSVVAFSRARFGKATVLENSIRSGALQQPTPNCVPPATTDFVAAEAKISRELSPEKKRFLN